MYNLLKPDSRLQVVCVLLAVSRASLLGMCFTSYIPLAILVRGLVDAVINPCSCSFCMIVDDAISDNNNTTAFMLKHLVYNLVGYHRRFVLLINVAVN